MSGGAGVDEACVKQIVSGHSGRGKGGKGGNLPLSLRAKCGSGVVPCGLVHWQPGAVFYCMYVFFFLLPIECWCQRGEKKQHVRVSKRGVYTWC